VAPQLWASGAIGPFCADFSALVLSQRVEPGLLLVVQAGRKNFSSGGCNRSDCGNHRFDALLHRREPGRCGQR